MQETGPAGSVAELAARPGKAPAAPDTGLSFHFQRQPIACSPQRLLRMPGGLTGLVSAVTLVILGPAVWKTVLGHDAAIFPWDNPALFLMPAAFLVAWAVSKLDHSPRALAEAAAFDEQYVRAQTGLGAAAAAAH